MEEQQFNNQGLETNEPGGPNKNKWLIVGLSAIVILMVGAVAVWLWRPQGESPVNNQPVVNQTLTATEKQDQAAAQKAQARGRIWLEPVQKTLAIGETLTVEIYMNTGGYDIVAASAALQYDPAKLELAGAKKKVEVDGSVLTIGMPDEVTSGLLTITRGKQGDGNWQDSDDGFNGEKGLLAKVSFTAKASGTAEITLRPAGSKLIFDDAKGGEMTVEYGNGQYEIK